MARKRLTEAEAEENLNSLMIDSGHRERLRERLHRKLEESGWREQVKLMVKDYIADRGAKDVTMEEAVQDNVPKATDMVPDKVRRDLLKEVQRILEERVQ